MQYHAKTPDEYVDALQEDWRKEKLLEVWQILEDEGPELTPGIAYKMLSFDDEKGTVFALNAQANYVSLYVGNTTKIDETGESLAGFNVGKGCIRIKKNNDAEQLRGFIRLTLEKRKARKDIDC